MCVCVQQLVQQRAFPRQGAPIGSCSASQQLSAHSSQKSSSHGGWCLIAKEQLLLLFVWLRRLPLQPCCCLQDQSEAQHECMHRCCQSSEDSSASSRSPSDTSSSSSCALGLGDMDTCAASSVAGGPKMPRRNTSILRTVSSSKFSKSSSNSPSAPSSSSGGSSCVRAVADRHADGTA